MYFQVESITLIYQTEKFIEVWLQSSITTWPRSCCRCCCSRIICNKNIRLYFTKKCFCVYMILYIFASVFYINQLITHFTWCTHTRLLISGSYISEYSICARYFILNIHWRSPCTISPIYNIPNTFTRPVFVCTFVLC